MKTVYVVCNGYEPTVLGVFETREGALAAIKAEYYPNEWKLIQRTVQP